MNIIFAKPYGRFILVAMFGKQSSQCNFCPRKVTEKSLGMIFKDKEGETLVCCNNIVCLLSAEEMRKMQ